MGSHLVKIDFFCRFLKGVFEIKPTIPKYSKIWDVGQVLTYLQSLNLNAEMSLKQLTHKLVMILALLTGQRCQTIHKLTLNLCKNCQINMFLPLGKSSNIRRLVHTRNQCNFWGTRTKICVLFNIWMSIFNEQ